MFNALLFLFLILIAGACILDYMWAKELECRPLGKGSGKPPNGSEDTSESI